MNQWLEYSILIQTPQFPHKKTEVQRVDAFAKCLKVVKCLAQKAIINIHVIITGIKQFLLFVVIGISIKFLFLIISIIILELG